MKVADYKESPDYELGDLALSGWKSAQLCQWNCSETTQPHAQARTHIKSAHTATRTSAPLASVLSRAHIKLQFLSEEPSFHMLGLNDHFYDDIENLLILLYRELADTFN